MSAEQPAEPGMTAACPPRVVYEPVKLTQEFRQFDFLSAAARECLAPLGEMLRAAQKNPQEYRDLVVRVAGFSEFFVNLTPDIQNEIIARTEHGGFQ